MHLHRTAQLLVIERGDEVARHGRPAHTADQHVLHGIRWERDLKGLGSATRLIEHGDRRREPINEPRAVNTQYLGKVQFRHPDESP